MEENYKFLSLFSIIVIIAIAVLLFLNTSSNFVSADGGNGDGGDGYGIPTTTPYEPPTTTPTTTPPPPPTTTTTIEEEEEEEEEEQPQPEFSYLTIMAAPNVIPYRKYMGDIGDYENYRSLDQTQYGDINNDMLPDVATGRIMGISSSDVSSYIARGLFYNTFSKTNNMKFLASSRELYISQANRWSSKFSDSGYNANAVTSEENCYSFSPAEWENQDLISYNDHGNPSWAGIGSRNIPVLSNSIIFNKACSTCSTYDGYSFCNRAIRQGALAHIGAVGISYKGNKIYMKTMNGIYYYGRTLGGAFRQAYSIKKYYYMTTLLGDPTLDINPPHRLKQRLKSESGGEACFSGDMHVLLQGDVSKNMRDLEIGDKVLTFNSGGRTEYVEVYAFLDHAPDELTTFLVLETDHGKLELTPDHLLFTKKGGIVYGARAIDIKVGDTLLKILNDHGTNVLTETTVLDIREVTRTGAYGPATHGSGTIAVNGFLASTYAASHLTGAYVPHTLINILFKPLRELTPTHDGRTTIKPQEGIHWYAEWLKEVFCPILPPGSPHCANLDQYKPTQTKE